MISPEIAAPRFHCPTPPFLRDIFIYFRRRSRLIFIFAHSCFCRPPRRHQRWDRRDDISFLRVHRRRRSPEARQIRDKDCRLCPTLAIYMPYHMSTVTFSLSLYFISMMTRASLREILFIYTVYFSLSLFFFFSLHIWLSRYVIHMPHHQPPDFARHFTWRLSLMPATPWRPFRPFNSHIALLLFLLSRPSHIFFIFRVSRRAYFITPHFTISFSFLMPAITLAFIYFLQFHSLIFIVSFSELIIYIIFRLISFISLRDIWFHHYIYFIYSYFTPAVVTPSYFFT